MSTHEFVPDEGHDDDECTYRMDGTDSTYCGRPEYDHDYGDCHRTEHVRLKLSGTCHECWRTIDPGETVTLTVGITDGEHVSNAACAHCAALRTIIHDGGCGEYYGGLEHCVDGALDHAGNRLPTPLLRAYVHFTRQWSRKNGQLHPIPTMKGA